MLSLYFNTFGWNDEILGNPQYVDNPKFWFDNNGGRHYVTGSMEREIIADIDGSEVLSENAVINPIFGGIPIQKISTTSKTVILVKNLPDKIFNGSRMGDNAAPWLLKIGDMQDVTIRLGYLMQFKEPFTIRIDNDGSIVTSWLDYVYAAVHYMYQGASEDIN